MSRKLADCASAKRKGVRSFFGGGETITHSSKALGARRRRRRGRRILNFCVLRPVTLGWQRERRNFVKWWWLILVRNLWLCCRRRNISLSLFFPYPKWSDFVVGKGFFVIPLFIHGQMSSEVRERDYTRYVRAAILRPVSDGLWPNWNIVAIAFPQKPINILFQLHNGGWTCSIEMSSWANVYRDDSRPFLPPCQYQLYHTSLVFFVCLIIPPLVSPRTVLHIHICCTHSRSNRSYIYYSMLRSWHHHFFTFLLNTFILFLWQTKVMGSTYGIFSQYLSNKFAVRRNLTSLYRCQMRERDKRGFANRVCRYSYYFSARLRCAFGRRGRNRRRRSIRSRRRNKWSEKPLLPIYVCNVCTTCAICASIHL